MAELYKIGTVSRLCGVPAHVIRYYEELGLIRSQHKTGSSTRYYDPFVFEQLLNIRTLRKLEFSIGEIQNLMSNPESADPFESYRLWTDKQEELLGRISELQAIVNKLEQMKKGDYYWQLCENKVLKVEMPDLYFYAQTYGDHSPALSENGVMDDVLERIVPFIRKIALTRNDSGNDFAVDFGFGIEECELHRLPSEQQKLLRKIPGGSFYVCRAKVDERCIIQADFAAPLYQKAAEEGKRGGMLLFELGYDGHLLCLLKIEENTETGGCA